MDIERILAIDYGHKRVGLALSDPLKIFAYPFKTLQNDDNFWDNLLKIISTENVLVIVLGYPLKESGEKSTSTVLIENFKKELELKVNLPIVLRDERYTSDMARVNILESVKSKKRRKDKGLVDMNAASILLQEYLDELKK